MAKIPSRAWLRASLLLWRRRERYRKARHDHWQRLVDRARRGDQHPRQKLIDSRDHWTKLLAQARAEIKLRERQLGPAGHANGIDVSSYQGTVDWAKIRAAGYTFAFVKLTQGTGYVNPFAGDQVKGARAAGLHVGGYHFLEHGNVYAQAEHFVAQLRRLGIGPGDLLPVQDVETGKHTPNTTDAAAFTGALVNLLKVKPLIYTFPAFADWKTTGGCKLWIANFGVKRPTIPEPWTAYAAWQHSSTAHVPGVAGDCDVNVTDHIEELIW